MIVDGIEWTLIFEDSEQRRWVATIAGNKRLALVEEQRDSSDGSRWHVMAFDKRGRVKTGPIKRTADEAIEAQLDGERI